MDEPVRRDEVYVRRMKLSLSKVGLCGVLVLMALAVPQWLVGAATLSLDLAASVTPITVQPGDTVTYTLTVRNSEDAGDLVASVVHSLPTGFSYLAGSTQILANHTTISTSDPAISGNRLTWSGLSVPRARSASYYGMHAFVQDRCDTSYIVYQLDRVRELMGPNAFVKQLLYRITVDTTGPQGCWVDFVNACYDRDLIPVVRLQGLYGGSYWIKPSAPSPGDYSEIAQAYARVVNGLPRRGNRPLYVEIWNEPNLHIEWSGQTNPVEYAHFLVDVAAAIRALGDSRIVVLNGALSPGGNYNPLSFIDAMAAVPGAMHAFDMWSTHPYPGNHPPEYNIHDGTADTYRELTVDGYLLELDRLAAHGRGGVPVLLSETGYALGQNNFGFQGYPPIDEANRADYISRAFRDHWSRWPEIVGVCPYELVDPVGSWEVWDWLYPSGGRHQQYDVVRDLDKTPPLAVGEMIIRFRARAGDQPGIHASRVEVVSGGADPLVLNDVAPVRVEPLPPTATPTATPTPAGTPAPTPVCYPVLHNGGFESQNGWELPTTGYTAGYSDHMAHGGTRSMRVGIVGDTPVPSFSSARQPFYLPPSSTSARISFWYYPMSEDTIHGRQYVLLLDSQKNILEWIMFIASDEGQWLYREYEVFGHAGETLWLHFGVKNENDGEGGATGMYVDDVEVKVCGPPGFLMPTPATTLVPAQWLPLIWKGESGSEPTGGPFPFRPPVLGASSPSPRLSAVDVSLPGRPTGINSLELPSWLNRSADVRAITLDAERRRLVLAVDEELLVLDALTGRTIVKRVLPAPAMALAVDAPSGRIYAVLPDKGELLVLEPDGSVISRVGELGRPSNVTVGLGRIYVTDVAQKRIFAFDRQGYGIMSVRGMPAAPHAMALDSLTGRLYVGQMGTGTVLALDAGTLHPMGQVALGGLGYPLDLALDAPGKRLYVAHSLSPKYGAISVIDTGDMSLLTTLWGNREQTLLGSDAVRLDEDRGIVLLGQSDGILALDARTLAIRGFANVRRDGWAGTLALDPLEGTVYAAGRGGRVWTWREKAPGD